MSRFAFPSTQRVAVGALISAVAAALTVWFLDNYEYADDRVYLGYQGEARGNSLLAAERFMRALGFRVQVAATLADLAHLPARGVLVVGADRWALPAQTQAQLLAWVRRGNTLILEAKPSALDDPLAAALYLDRAYVSHAGGTLRPRPGVPTPGVQARPEAQTAPPPVRGELYTLPWMPSRAYRVVLAKWQSISLRQGTVEFTLRDERGAYVIGFPLGEGRVVAFSNFLPWFNWGIGDADNAIFLAHIAGRQGRADAIIFFRNPVKLSAWKWLFDHAPLALAAAAALVGLWLWRALVRSGPLIADPAPARRRWADHIEAAGRFLWHSGARARLVERAREAAFSSAEQRIPGFGALPVVRKKDILMRQFAFTATEADEVLGRTGTSASGLIGEARLLRRLHEAGALRKGIKDP